MRLSSTSLLPCSVERLGAELSRPALLHRIAAPMLIFVASDPTGSVERWQPGKFRFRLLVGGRIPIGEHTINVQHVTGGSDEVPTRQLVWHDAGYSDLIRVWDHKIVLEPFHGMTRYTDQVEISAGPLTVAAWLFAKVFYAHRQRRLSRLVAAGLGG